MEDQPKKTYKKKKKEEETTLVHEGKFSLKNSKKYKALDWHEWRLYGSLRIKSQNTEHLKTPLELFDMLTIFTVTGSQGRTCRVAHSLG